MDTSQYELFTIDDMSGLERFIISNPDMEKKMRSIIRKQMSKARRGAISDLRGMVGSGYPNSNGDPRDAYKAVKMQVYKRSFGGNISILQKRRASSMRVNVSGAHRAGDRRVASARTQQINSYYGSDRGFILRFLSSGTSDRAGNRGSIRGRDLFGTVGPKNIEAAVMDFERQMAAEIEAANK